MTLTKNQIIRRVHKTLREKGYVRLLRKSRASEKTYQTFVNPTFILVKLPDAFGLRSSKAEELKLKLMKDLEAFNPEPALHRIGVYIPFAGGGS